MRVNSAFNGQHGLNSRLVVGSGTAMVMLFIFFITSSFTERPDRGLWAKEVNLMIRQIGHRLLLQAGDSTSRVLPVTEIKEGTFQLRFENDVFFSHDSLIELSQGLLPKTKFPSGYTVTVHEFMKADIVYGFQINSTSPDMLACRGRSEPPGRYRIEIAFPDLFASVKPKENVTQKKAVFDQLNEEPKSIKAGQQEANPRPKELKMTTLQRESLITAPPRQSYRLINLVLSGMLVVLGVTLLIGRLGKNLKPVPGKNRDHAILKESVSEFTALGKFLFDIKGQRLLLGEEVICLTDKECRILELLNENFGELIPRETLMQKVWIDEGVITGRSLDMFVSKLRKKLSRDPELRITNIHRKGYKLEIPGIQIS